MYTALYTHVSYADSSIEAKSTSIVLPPHFAGSGKRAHTFATIQGISGFVQVKPEDLPALL